MQVLSCSSAFCLLAICGLLLRSQTLVSASRSPNFTPSDPTLESDTVSNELIHVIWLLLFLLAAPAILAIILQPRAILALNAAVISLRKTKLFGSISVKHPPSMQPINLQAKSSPKSFARSVIDSSQVEDIDFTIGKSQKLAPLALEAKGVDFFEGSQISARRTVLPYHANIQ